MWQQPKQNSRIKAVKYDFKAGSRFRVFNLKKNALMNKQHGLFSLLLNKVLFIQNWTIDLLSRLL